MPYLKELSIVNCAPNIVPCLDGLDLRTVETLRIHRQDISKDFFASYPNIKHWDAGNAWSYADLPQPHGVTIDVGL